VTLFKVKWKKMTKEEWIMRITQLLIGFLILFCTPVFAKTPSLCQTEGYQCVKVKRGQTWESLFPDETERDIVMRINHTNHRLYAGQFVLVPDNLGAADVLSYSPLSLTIPASDEKKIIVNLNKNAWGAYGPDGQLVAWGPATGGASWCRDIGRSCRTKAGEFRLYSLGAASCKSTKYPAPKGGAPMPYCMFFNGGQALHGSP
jgi:L,D-transpeptidase ErfK/SrfK